MQAVRGSMSIHGHLHEKAAAADALPVCRRTAGIELISAVVDGCHKSCPARHVNRSGFSNPVKFAFALHPRLCIRAMHGVGDFACRTALQTQNASHPSFKKGTPPGI